MRRKIVTAAGAWRRGFSIVLLLFPAAILSAQELQPRAYLPSPVGLGFLGLSYSGNAGGLLFDPSLPIENGHVDASIPSLALGGTLDVFGRTAQVLGVLPYAVADLSGRRRAIGPAWRTQRFAFPLTSMARPRCTAANSPNTGPS
jgi:hypothetical protein